MKSSASRLPLRVVVAAVAAAAAAATSAHAIQSVAVPAYFYPVFPDPVWARMEAAYPTAKIAIMNPASGPGAGPDANYTSQIPATQAAGIRVLGYVTSSYATRALVDIEAEIDDYYDWYGVDGIFIDEADNTCGNAGYYASLTAYVKSKDAAATTVINPGTVTPECFATSADVILNFEGTYATYAAWTPLGWEAGYDPSLFWHLVYDTAEADVDDAVALSQARGAGWVYVTDDVLANPWDTIPPASYWQSELEAVNPLAGDCQVEVVKPRLVVGGVATAEDDDSLKFSGRFTLAGAPPFDPVVGGLRFLVGDGGGTRADVTVGAGAFDGEVGWRQAGAKWIFLDRSATPAQGVGKIVLGARERDGDTEVRFKIIAKRGSYPLDTQALPAAAKVMLDGSDPSGLCGDAGFPGPSSPRCRTGGAGTKVICK